MIDKIIIEGKDCTNCQKMSHCHNNDLICQNRYRSVLEQLQAEQQKVKELSEANDEKNEFLQSLGISAGGERKRIKYYIDKLQEQNKSLQQELRTEKEKVRKLEESAGFWGRTTSRVQSERDKYTQALEEIKEIVEHYFSLHPLEISNRHIFEVHLEYIQDVLEVLND